MERLGGETWFKLGDRDLATHVLRTQELDGRQHPVGGHARCSRGGSASRIRVAPMSDDPVRSIVETDEGPLDFQDYFVRRQCKPAISRRDVPGRGTTHGRQRRSATRSTTPTPSSSRPPTRSSASIRSWRCRAYARRFGGRDGRSSPSRRSSAAGGEGTARQDAARTAGSSRPP